MPDPLPINLPQPAAHQWLNLHPAQPVLQTSPSPDQNASAPHIAGNPDVVIAVGGAVDAHPRMVEQGDSRGIVNSQVPIVP